MFQRGQFVVKIPSRVIERQENQYGNIQIRYMVGDDVHFKLSPPLKKQIDKIQKENISFGSYSDFVEHNLWLIIRYHNALLESKEGYKDEGI